MVVHLLHRRCRRFRRKLCAAAVLTVVHVGSSAASAQALAEAPSRDSTTPDDAEIAREAMRVGLVEFRGGDLQAARQHFLRAWQLVPHAATAAPLAEVEMALGYHLAALELWRFYEENVASENDKAVAAERVAECLRHLGQVRIDVLPADASLTLPGRHLVARDPADGFVVEPGDHEVRARRDGHVPQTAIFSVEAGQRVEVEMVLQPRPPAAPEPVPPARQEDGLPVREVLVIGGGSLTMVALTAGLIFHIDTSSWDREVHRLAEQVDREGDPEQVGRNSQCHPEAPNPPPSCGALLNAVTEHGRARDRAMAAYATAGVLAGTTLAFWLLWPKTAGDASTRDARSAAWTLSPWGPSGLQVSGTF